MSKLDDKLAASVKLAVDPAATAKPAPKKSAVRKSANSASVKTPSPAPAVTPSPARQPEPCGAAAAGDKVEEVIQGAARGRSLHPRRVWPD